MTRPVRIAIVGAGYFARFHYDAWNRLAEANLVALCDRDRAKGEALAADYGVPAVFDDLETMMAEVRPDLVDIVVPPDAHLPLIRSLARHDTAVSCQKPFCGGLEGGLEAVNTAREKGLVLAVHENFRFQPWYREIKRLLEAGALGQLFQASFRLRPGDGRGAEAYLERQPYFQEMPRFLVHETAIHFIDSFRYLLGEPSGLFARLTRLNPVIAGEDAGFLLFEFEGGTRALFDGNRLADHAASNRRLTMGELLLEGSAASLRLDGDGRLWLRAFGSGDEVEHPYEWQDRGFGGDCVRAFNRHLLDHLRRGAPLETAASDYLVNQAIEEAVYLSHEEARWVSAAEWRELLDASGGRRDG